MSEQEKVNVSVDEEDNFMVGEAALGSVAPDGEIALGEGRYVLDEVHANVVLYVYRDHKTGKTELMWRRTKETIDIDYTKPKGKRYSGDKS